MLRRAAACGALVALCVASPAAADIYWANQGAGTIGRADGDGTAVDDSFIEGAAVAASPHAVAVDAGFLYWAHDGVATDDPAGNIGRAPLSDPTMAAPTFVATAGSPKGMTLDQGGIFWTQVSAGVGAIGRANVANGVVTGQSHVANIGATPCGLTTDADKFFWALSGAPGQIMRSHGTFPPFSELLPAAFPAGTTDNPCGVAEANGNVYWANQGNDTIGRVDLTGTTLAAAIPTADSPCGVAVDGGHVYWTEQGADQISRADVDGSNVNAGPDFPITLGASDDPCGIAVDPTAKAEPELQTFADTVIGDSADTATLVLRNTSSSVLDTSAVSIIGADQDDFVLAGDGCTVNIVPAGQICVLNVDFSPTATGPRSAAVRVTTNASNSPTDFALSGAGVAPAIVPPEEPPPAPPVEPGSFARALSLAYAGKSDRFKGRLSSENAGCAADQKVVVFERGARGKRVGSDRTTASGRWRVEADDADGRFYAVAKQSSLADGATCLAAESKALKVG